MFLRFRHWTYLVFAGCLILLLSPAGLIAKTVVLPVEAIEASRRMPYDEFRERYPGIDVTSSMLDSEGYYVRYRHENLTYYFGPLAERDQAEHYYNELVRIRHAAVDKREELATSEIDIYQFTWDKAGEATGGERRVVQRGQTGPVQESPGGRAERPGPEGMGPGGQIPDLEGMDGDEPSGAEGDEFDGLTDEELAALAEEMAGQEDGREGDQPFDRMGRDGQDDQPFQPQTVIGEDQIGQQQQDQSRQQQQQGSRQRQSQQQQQQQQGQQSGEDGGEGPPMQSDEGGGMDLFSLIRRLFGF